MRMRTSFFITFLTLAQFFLSDASAQIVYSGTLLKDKSKIYLVNEDKSAFLLKSEDKSVYNTLLSLETGDSAVLMAQLPQDQTLLVENVLRVGIQKILGMWVGKEEFLKFDDFDAFRTFEPNFQNDKLVGIHAQKFRYYLIPDTLGRFVISYTNNQSKEITAATLGLSDSKLMIEMIDNDTGKVKERKRYDRMLNNKDSAPTSPR